VPTGKNKSSKEGIDQTLTFRNGPTEAVPVEAHMVLAVGAEKTFQISLKPYLAVALVVPGKETIRHAERTCRQKQN